MKSLMESLNDLIFDKRMIRWNMNKKILTSGEYEKHLKQLEDISHLQNTEKIKEKEESSGEEKS